MKISRDIRQFTVRKHFGICLFLVLCCLFVFWQVREFEFIHYDDDLYVLETPRVRDGVTSEGIGWSFTATRGGNWHPLTWMSHMTDVQLYGLDPGRHHLTGVLFHTLTTLLVFIVFRRMTGKDLQSWLVAMLFAVHPTHVESVAWVSERKDVLSAFFWMLTVWAYSRYAAQPEVRRYLWVVLFFILGLMAKPMLVSLPFVLLLLDFWPLRRFRLETTGGIQKIRSTILSLVLEKLPLFLLSVAVGLVTVSAQQRSGALRSLETYSLPTRMANAVVSYVLYLKKMIWPVDLAVPYPHPGIVPIRHWAPALVVMTILTFIVIHLRRRYPYLIVGWFWYIGTLVPAIGIVQVGSQAMADRYTYLPFVGLFVIVAWGGSELASKWRVGKRLLTGIVASLCAVLMIIAWRQTGYWKNAITLFEHAVTVTEKNHAAYNNLGIAFAENGRLTEAVRCYSEGLTINPNHIKLRNNLGAAFLQMGQADAAVDHLRKALRIKPNDPKAHLNMGDALSAQEKLDDAIAHYHAALQGDPNNLTALNNLANTLQKQGRLDEAIGQYRASLRVGLDDPVVYNNLGVALLRKGDGAGAVSHFQKALALRPGYPEARNNLKVALAALDAGTNRNTETDGVMPIGSDDPDCLQER